MSVIIGRKEEIRELEYYRDSDKSEFVALYGRRRVGKTFLVRNLFAGQFAFCHTGLSPYDDKSTVTKSDQLDNFYSSLTEWGMEESHSPQDWLEAFQMLKKLLQEKQDGNKQIVFIDELPWLDTKGSGFITALESFWNGWASFNNVFLIVCGSATSWMLDKLINNVGGLYGRLSTQIHLMPFRLKECEEFFQSRGILMSRYDIVQAYMLFGGIPYYIEKFRKGLSFAQNIDRIMFNKSAVLNGEFDRLFGSLFSNPEQHQRVIACIGMRRSGLSRTEVSDKTGISSGEGLTRILKSLENSEFILKYRPFNNAKSQSLYKLIDPFCISHLKFAGALQQYDEQFWQHYLDSPAFAAWKGIAFVEVCMLHVKQIKQALQVGGVHSVHHGVTLSSDENHEATQIDLLISRSDNVVNLCEMKFSNAEFEIDKSYDKILRNRISLLEKQLKKTQCIHLTFITPFGVKQNVYAGIVQNNLTIDDLFN